MDTNKNNKNKNAHNGTPKINYEFDTFFSNLYYGSIENLVYLVPCAGRIYNDNPNDFQNIQNESSIQSSLDNFHKLPLLGEEYKNIHCIGIPANDIIYTGSESEWIPSENYNKTLFEEKQKSESKINSEEEKEKAKIHIAFINNLDKNNSAAANFCLIKVSKETIEKQKLSENEYIAGFQSGKRSCIVKLNKKFYRLKGCGNLSEGFPIKNMNFPKGAFELRGCQYRYSAIREAYMTERISQLLSRKNNYCLQSTNFPVNIWEYGEVESSKLGLRDELKKIPKFCSVYEAIGEKRLGCHLLPGIELILAKFLDGFIKEQIIDGKLIQEILNDNGSFDSVYSNNEHDNSKLDNSIRSTKADLNANLNNHNHIGEQGNKRKLIVNCLVDKIKNLEANVFKLFEENRLEKTFASKLTAENDAGSYCMEKMVQQVDNFLRNVYQPEKQVIATSEIVELIELDREKGERLSDLFSKHEIYKDASSGNRFKKLREIIVSENLIQEENLILEIFSHKNILLYSSFPVSKSNQIVHKEKNKINNNINNNNNNNNDNDNDDHNMEKSINVKPLNYFNLNFLVDDLPMEYIKTDDLKKHDNLDIHFQYSELQESVLFRVNRIFSFLKQSELNFLEFISAIYEKLGYEAGKFKRILQDENINWGTYEDLPFRFHSNAHTDNFCILPRKFNFNSENNENIKGKKLDLLSILDFDLAFFRENFFNILAEEGKEKFKKPDDCLYDFYICNERQVLEWEISGMENFISFDLLKNKFENDALFSLLFKPIVYLLRDSAVLGFREGYLLKNFENQKFFEENAAVVYDFVELGLLSSNHILG